MPKLTDDLLLEVFLYTIFYHHFSAVDAYDSLDGFLKNVENIKVEVGVDDYDNDEVIEFEETEIENVAVGSLISKPTIIKVHSLWKYIPFSTKEKQSLLKQALLTGVPELRIALSGSPIDISKLLMSLQKIPR